MQETDPDGQGEPTLQTNQQEQSHESTEGTEGETPCEQKEQPVQVPDVMPNIAHPQGRKRGRGRDRTPGQGSSPRRGMGRGHIRSPSRQQTAWPAGQYVPNFTWNDTKSDGDYRPINILFTGVDGLREEITCRANRIFFKVLYWWSYWYHL